MGRQHERAFHHGRPAFLIEKGHEGLADGQFGDYLLHVESGIRAQRRRCRLHGFLVARRKGAQRVLHAVAELSKYGVGYIQRILRHEINAHALGSDQPDHLLDLVEQRRRGVVEQQMRFVEEEHQFRFFRIADFGQFLEQFRQQPQQQRGIGLRRVHQLVGGEDVDHAPALFVGLHQVGDVERRLAEEMVAALFIDADQPALDCADAGGGDVAVLGGELLRVVADMLDHRPQVLQVQQEQALVIGNLEHQRQHAALRVVQVQQSRE